MRVIDINGRLATAGSWDETSQSEADAQARLRATRTGLRAMLAGNDAFHVDPMAAPTPEEKPWPMETQPDGSVNAVDPADMPDAVRESYGVNKDGSPVAAAAEVWHTEAPTVAGVYAIDYAFERVKRGNKWCAWYDGASWHTIAYEQDAEAVLRARRNEVTSSGIVWLRLIEADTPAPAAQIPDWRTCDQVPKHERVGLWHYKNRDGISKARPAKVLGFKTERTLYRPAAPGAVENDLYDESRYSIQA